MPLPTLIVIGGMKCGTSALHHYLDRHPEIAMAPEKELNFFFGPAEPTGDPDTWWQHGQWARGEAWYSSRFDGTRRLRGESSPGYTDPGHPAVAERMAGMVPDVRLVCLVRDPVGRAVSQWRHHLADGTEPRGVAEAVLDPHSQYVARSRYAERLEPFLHHFPREQLHVVVHERLLAARRLELAHVYAHVGADPGFWDPALGRRVHVGAGPAEPISPRLRSAFAERVADDVERLRHLLGDPLPEWTV